MTFPDPTIWKLSAYNNCVRRIVGVIADDIDITTLFHDILCENVQDASVYAFNDPIQALKHYRKPVKLRIGNFRFKDARAQWAGVA